VASFLHRRTVFVAANGREEKGDTMAMAQMTDKAALYREIEQMFGKVPEWIRLMPDTAIGGFWLQFRDFYFAETKIPNKYKELIGLGVSGATRCKYCALFHTEAAKLFGATDEEIAEASAMAALSMQASTFLNAEQVDYEKFKKETLEIVEYVKAHAQPQKPETRPEQRARA
jgi:AhpD family alkylhydroperoxidase